MPARDADHEAYWARPLEEMLGLRSCQGAADLFEADLDGFGGVTLGCAARAAARSCPDRPAGSLHASFLRPVPLDRPTRFAVEVLRDGRRFSHRRVRVLDGERPCAELVARFGVPGSGAPAPDAAGTAIDFQEAGPEPGLPGPDALESDARSWQRAHGEQGPPHGPLEWRWIGVPWDPEEPHPRSRYHGWVRPRTPLPDLPELRPAALAFLADYHSHFPVARRLGGPFEPAGYTSLDQTLWIHRDLPWDDWWLACTESDVAHAGRALTRRSVFSRDGRLVATMVQEQLVPAQGSGP